MTLSVYLHEREKLTLVVYSDRINTDDLALFGAFFSRPDIFPLENDGIALLQTGADFSDLDFRQARALALDLEKTSIRYQQEGKNSPDLVPLVISSLTQRIVTKLWMAVADQTPLMKPKYKVVGSIEEGLAVLNMPPDLAADIATRANFTKLDPSLVRGQ